MLRGAYGAVDAARSRNRVHRDLKPENLFLVGRPDDGMVKPLGFGVAKPVAAPEEAVAGEAEGLTDT